MAVEYSENPLEHLSDDDLSRRIVEIVHGVTNVRDRSVGDEGLVRIWQHSPAFPGDHLYFDLEYEDGKMMLRLFDVTKVYYGPPPKVELEIDAGP